MREKVITNKETHEHPVIYGSLEGGEEEREGGREREIHIESTKFLFLFSFHISQDREGPVVRTQSLMINMLGSISIGHAHCIINHDRGILHLHNTQCIQSLGWHGNCTRGR